MVLIILKASTRARKDVIDVLMSELRAWFLLR